MRALLTLLLLAGLTGAAGAASPGPGPVPFVRGQLPGTAIQDNAAPGNVGEYVESFIALGTGPTLTSGNAVNLASVNLTAGDWDCAGTAMFDPASTTSVTAAEGSVSEFSGSLGNGSTGGAFAAVTPAYVPNASFGFPTGDIRVAVNSGGGAAPIYLVVEAKFSVSTMSAYGDLHCRRAR